MKITWLGTAAIRIEAGGERLLFDPFVELAGSSNPNSLEDFLEDTDICITHGHVDHLFFVPELVEGADATVHCTKRAADTLEKYLEENGNIIRVSPGDSWRLGGMRITVYKGKHIRFSPALVLRKVFSWRLFRHLKNTIFLAWAHLRFPEKGETVVYEVEAEGKKLLLLGSMALDDQTAYPEEADVLILPYQGTNQPEKEACRIIERLRPKRVILDHFDDAFPPASEEMDTRRLKTVLSGRFPLLPVVKPKAGKPIVL